MFCMRKKKKIYPVYVSKYNANREKQVILLMISNGEIPEAKSEGRRQWHYLAVKTLSVFLRKITSKNNGDFYCLNCLCSFRTKNKLESHEKACENKDFWNVIMPSDDTKILEFNQNKKSDKAPFIIYADLECIIRKIDGCKNNPENSTTTKVSEHIPSGFSMSGDFYHLNCLCSFRTKNKLESHEKACENKNFWNVIMPSDDTKILEFNQNKKSDKAPFIIYADLECIIRKTDGCKNNPQNSTTTKVSEHIPSGFSMSGDFYHLNCLCSFRTKNKLESHEKACENKDFWNVIMPSDDTKILEFNQNKKSDKAPFIIYADLECIIRKIDGCKNNPQNSTTTKVSEHIPSGFSMSGDFYHLNCLCSFRTKNKLESHGKACENKDFWNVIMPSDDTKILEFNQNKKSDKAPFIIYADLECIIRKIDGCKNNPQNSTTTKVSEHIPSGFSMSTISSFRSIENKHDVCRGKDCMKRFCEFLREHAMKIINFKKKKIKLLTKAQQESYEHGKICYICKEKFEINYLKDKKHRKVTDHYHYTG